MHPKIVGKDWTLWIIDGALGWYHDGTNFVPLDMVNQEFPPERIISEYQERHVNTWGTKFGPLFDDVLAFLKTWGIEARGENLPPMMGEAGAFD